MGYYCMICNAVTTASTVNELVHHFNYRHGITAMQKYAIRCGQNDCARSFDSIHALRMHLKRHHPTDTYPNHSLDTDGTDCDDSDTDCDGGGKNEGTDEGTDSTYDMSVDDIYTMFIDFIIVLKSKNLAQSIIDFVCQGFVNLTLAVAQFCAVPQQTTADGSLDFMNRKEAVEIMCQSVTANSDYKIKKYLQERKQLVTPSEIFLGNRTEMVTQNKQGSTSSSVKYIPETMQYISVINTLEKLLNDTDNLAIFSESTTVTPKNVQESENVLRSFADSENFKQHALLETDSTFLQLHFFYDEFETVNPLGSKTNIHKIGGLYMCIRNIPSVVISQQKYIFPVVYCHAADCKAYGFNKILEPLLADLKALENGVQMRIKGKYETIYGAVVMWSGDNLGIHQLFGFSPNFNAERCCQFCYSSREERQTCFRESDVVIRTMNSHKADCNRLSVNAASAKETGVHSSCSLSELKYFAIPDNVCPDAMHDILEGSLQYELKLVVRQLIMVDKIMSLPAFNSRMQSIAYGVDSKNKPQPLSVDTLQGKAKKLGMNASQSWCFARYFCLLVGDLNLCNDYLQLVQLMLDIMDIIFAPAVTVSMTFLLEELIVQHHLLFRKLFPDDCLIPKQHLLIHYPSKIRKLGPCVQYWCMRFESKHASAKDFCRFIRNFKNICKSVAWRQQITLCVEWMVPREVYALHVGTGSVLLPCTLPVSACIFEELGIPVFEEVYIANYVTVNGCQFAAGSTVILGHDAGLPLFGQVVFIAFYAGRIGFIVKKLITYEHCVRVHAFKVALTQDLCGIDYRELVDSHPVNLVAGFGADRGCQFVVLRHEILSLQ